MSVAQKPVLLVHNHHVPACGDPPQLETDAKLCTAYFEDCHGEQWLIQVDRETLAGTVYGGDCGWEHPIRISEGRIEGDVILGGDVQRWLAVAWEAATGTPLFQRPFDVLLQQAADPDSHDTNAGPLLPPDVAVTAYIHCGAVQDAEDAITDAIDSFEDDAGETEVILTWHELQAIAAALDACLVRGSVPIQ